MAKLKYDEELLDSMINYVQLEEYEEKLKKEKKLFFSRLKKCALILAAPLLAVFFINPASEYFYLYALGDLTFICASATYASKILVNYKERSRYLSETHDDIRHIDEPISYITLKREGMITKDPEAFYTNEYWVYKNSIDKNVELVQDKRKLQLSKNDSIEQINENIKNYYCNYELPSNKVKDEQFNKFLELAYDVFEEINKEEKFYEYMSSVCGYAISKSLVNERKTLEIDDFINALSYLKCCDLSDKDITKIKEKVTNFNKEKIVDFAQYQKRYEKKSS